MTPKQFSIQLENNCTAQSSTPTADKHNTQRIRLPLLAELTTPTYHRPQLGISILHIHYIITLSVADTSNNRKQWYLKRCHSLIRGSMWAQIKNRNS